MMRGKRKIAARVVVHETRDPAMGLLQRPQLGLYGSSSLPLVREGGVEAANCQLWVHERSIQYISPGISACLCTTVVERYRSLTLSLSQRRDEPDGVSFAWVAASVSLLDQRRLRRRVSVSDVDDERDPSDGDDGLRVNCAH